jgi:hypothetical protein
MTLALWLGRGSLNCAVAAAADKIKIVSDEIMVRLERVIKAS